MKKVDIFCDGCEKSMGSEHCYEYGHTNQKASIHIRITQGYGNRPPDVCLDCAIFFVRNGYLPNEVQPEEGECKN